MITLDSVSDNHNDHFDIEVQFQKMWVLEHVGIRVDGLFFNTDAGFDSQKLRDQYSIKELLPI